MDQGIENRILELVFKGDSLVEILDSLPTYGGSDTRTGVRVPLYDEADRFRGLAELQLAEVPPLWRGRRLNGTRFVRLASTAAIFRRDNLMLYLNSRT